MRRAAWAAFGLLVGLALAVWAAGRLRGVSRALTPGGVAEQLERVAGGLRGWREEIRQAAAEREAELRASLFGQADELGDRAGQSAAAAGRRFNS